MSSAANHRKRSHRSQRLHMKGSQERHRIAVAGQLKKNLPGFFGRFIRRFRTGTSEGK